jgi:hypothetical protein
MHACSEADNRENNFSVNFSSVSVFQCEAFGLSLLASERVRLRRPEWSGYMSRLARPVACLCGNARPDKLMIRPAHRLYIAGSDLAVASHFFPLIIFSCFFILLRIFIVGQCIISASFVFLYLFLSIPGTFFVPFILFSVLLTVSI